MMKKHYIKLYIKLVISMFFVLVYLSSANAGTTEKIQKMLEKADMLFYEKNYESALKTYLKAFKKDNENSYCSEKIAYTYLYLNEIKKALSWFQKTEKIYGSFVPDFAVRYALALMEAGEYELARDKFQEYNDFFESDNPLVYKYLLSIENKDRYYDDSTYYDLMNTVLSSKQANFSPQYYNGNLMYINSALSDVGEAPTYRKTGLLSATVNENDEIEPVGYVKGSTYYTKKILSLSIAEKSNQIFGTYVSNSEDPMKLYQMVRGDIIEGDEISKMVRVRVNDFDMNILHVTVNDTGDKIIFASDAPGGYGGFDLYSAELAKGKFTNVTNLGQVINTSEDELFPYLLNDSTLYFSSKGHGGLGGFDLFYTNLSKENNIPKNLGYPVNTNADEFTLSFYSDFVGFISSNRVDGQGLEDIYKFKIDNIKYKSIITDEQTGESLQQVDVSIDFSDGKQEQLALADNGTLIFDITPGDEFDIAVNKQGYEERTFHVDSKEWVYTGQTSYNGGKLPMKPIEGYSEPIAMNTQSSNVSSDAGTTGYVEVIEPGNVNSKQAEKAPEETVVEKKSPKPVSTTYHYENLNHGIDFLVQIAAAKKKASEKLLQNIYKGDLPINYIYYNGWYIYYIAKYSSYYDAKALAKICGVKNAYVSAYKDNNRLRLMDAIKLAHVPKEENLENLSRSTTDAIKKDVIYFNYDQVILTDRDMNVIYSFVDALNANPSYYLELIGYSDKQGSIVYNKAISYQRATNIQQMFLVEGIDQKRLETYGYGEGNTSHLHKNPRRVEIIMRKR